MEGEAHGQTTTSTCGGASEHMATTYWKDLITIPDAVQASDFVLKLSDGVLRAKATVDSYVVTTGVARAFDEALGLIGSSLQGNSSKATYLHGSFGSGKSHFMAVLDLLLDREHSHLVRGLKEGSYPFGMRPEFWSHQALPSYQALPCHQG